MDQDTDTLIITLKVNVHTLSEWSGSCFDYAVIELSEALIARIRRLAKAVAELGAASICDWDCTPEIRWAEGDPRVECLQLCVQDGSFWWGGVIKHSDISWETTAIDLAQLDALEPGSTVDLRDDVDEDEVVEEVAS